MTSIAMHFFVILDSALLRERLGRLVQELNCTSRRGHFGHGLALLFEDTRDQLAFRLAGLAGLDFLTAFTGFSAGVR
jgi:hypothetical protein